MTAVFEVPDHNRSRFATVPLRRPTEARKRAQAMHIPSSSAFADIYRFRHDTSEIGWSRPSLPPDYAWNDNNVLVWSFLAGPRDVFEIELVRAQRPEILILVTRVTLLIAAVETLNAIFAKPHGGRFEVHEFEANIFERAVLVSSPLLLDPPPMVLQQKQRDRDGSDRLLLCRCTNGHAVIRGVAPNETSKKAALYDLLDFLAVARGYDAAQYATFAGHAVPALHAACAVMLSHYLPARQPPVPRP